MPPKTTSGQEPPLKRTRSIMARPASKHIQESKSMVHNKLESAKKNICHGISLQATAKKPFWVELGHILSAVAVLCLEFA